MDQAVGTVLRSSEEMGDRGGWLLDSTTAQVVAVGVDESWPVGWSDTQGLGFRHAGVAFDGVRGHTQAAGAVEQADALAEEIVNLVPGLAGGQFTYSAETGRVDGGPAASMRADFELDLVTEIPPEVTWRWDREAGSSGPPDGHADIGSAWSDKREDYSEAFKTDAVAL